VFSDCSERIVGHSYRDPAAAQNIDPAKSFYTGQSFNEVLRLDEALRDLERSYVEAALDLTRGNLSQAARLLGIHRTTLYSRMQNFTQDVEEGT